MPGCIKITGKCRLYSGYFFLNEVAT